MLPVSKVQEMVRGNVKLEQVVPAQFQQEVPAQAVLKMLPRAARHNPAGIKTASLLPAGKKKNLKRVSSKKANLRRVNSAEAVISVK